MLKDTVRKRFFTVISGVAVSALVITTGAQAAGARASTPTGGSLTQQIAAAYSSTAGLQVRSLLNTLLTDPALPQTGSQLLAAQGPAGSNTLTAFQVGMLKALILATKNPALISARLSGKPLSGIQWLETVALRARLEQNPAVRTLMTAGSQFRTSSELPGDVSAATSDLGTVYTSLTPPASANQGGSAALDTVVADIAALRTSSAFNGLANQLAPAVTNAGFQKLVQSQPPFVVSEYMPAAEMLSLQLRNTDIFTAADFSTISDIVLDIILPLAGYILAVLTFPADASALVIVTFTIALIGAVEAEYKALVLLGNAFDCDHDGDPFDPADVPGNEC